MQDYFAIWIVAAAALFLVRRMWLSIARRRSGTCGSCTNCGAGETIKTRPLVMIATDYSHAKAQRREE
jgi:hypothetical protein